MLRDPDRLGHRQHRHDVAGGAGQRDEARQPVAGTDVAARALAQLAHVRHEHEAQAELVRHDRELRRQATQSGQSLLGGERGVERDGDVRRFEGERAVERRRPGEQEGIVDLVDDAVGADAEPLGERQ